MVLELVRGSAPPAGTFASPLVLELISPEPLAEPLLFFRGREGGYIVEAEGEEGAWLAADARVDARRSRALGSSEPWTIWNDAPPRPDPDPPPLPIGAYVDDGLGVSVLWSRPITVLDDGEK